MDMTYPIRAVVPTLDGPVLAVLARTTRPLSGLEVHRVAGTGSPNGVRMALARLVRQGVVHADERAGAVFYTANRAHVAWPAIEALAGLRHAMLDRIRESVRAWPIQPVHASLFGSVARADGDESSDVDVLLVRPDVVDADETAWDDQVDALRVDVQNWTGNHCQPFEVTVDRLADHVNANDPLVDDWLRDGVAITGDDLRAVVRRTRSRGGKR